MQKITTFLTFESKGKEAVDFYVSIFKNSQVNSSMVMPGGDQLLHASFSLDGEEYMAMDGGEHFKFEQGTSLFVTCQDQEEVDYFWDKLSEGGEPGQCGWLKDKFGMSWQIIPKALGELMQGPDPEKSQRVMQAMLKMNKIDVAKLKEAHDQ
ncbi:MAG: 3-demethylubiquinone-9 3-methyltransferase [Candidatus Saccharibacteria bacterium]|nr:3-demethylubiquinone-9 3-methyltransferase [Candidatus Saccharibacteria bacterium]